MTRKHDGSIFGVRDGAEFTPMELLNTIAKFSNDDDCWIIDADDPQAFLRHVESVPLAIVKKYEANDAIRQSWVQGVGACHLYGNPPEPPPVFIDALEMVVQLGKLWSRLNSTWRSDGGLIAVSVQVGFLLAMLHGRNYEYFASLGKSIDQNLSGRRQGKPITAKAKRLFSAGASVRQVADVCQVGYQVARRWKILSKK